MVVVEIPQPRLAICFPGTSASHGPPRTEKIHSPKLASPAPPANWPDRLAVVGPDGTATYGQLLEASDRAAAALLDGRADLGEARVDVDSLLTASLRLRPDRILLGELRGSEAFAFLRAVNSGHPGSITTIHADSADGALDQIGLLALTSGLELGWDTVRDYVTRVVDAVVQLERVGGSRRITDIRLLRRA